MKTIIIRDLSDATLARIDEKARKAGLSRQAYLVDYLENAFASRATQNQMDIMLKVISMNTSIMSDVVDALNENKEEDFDYE